MSFLSPAYLWILAALAPLVAIYFLKIRPRRLPVTAFFLWDKVFAEKRASSLFQRLRDFISLLLLALVIAALALAAAGPRFAKDDQRDLLIVIDVSPSMGSAEGGKSEFEKARARAKAMIQALNGTRRAALATVAGNLEFHCHLSSAPKDLLDSLDRITVSDEPVSDRAIDALNQLAKNAGADGRVVLLTDGNGGMGTLDSAVLVERIGQKADNAGIVAADLVWADSGKNEARFFYRIASTFPVETHAELELRHEDGGGLMRLVPVVLTPDGETSDTLSVEEARPGRWVAELRIADALAADNSVPLGLMERRSVQVRLDAGDEYFFARCVDAFAATGGLLERAAQGGDLTIANAGHGSVSEDRRVLVFHPQGESPFWKSVGDEMVVQAVETRAAEHPLVRNLDLDGLRFDGARKVVPADGSLILAVSETGEPLMWKSQVADRTAVVVNLDPAQGDFFLSPWFPAMVHSAALHLADREEALLSVYSTGGRVIGNGEFTSPIGETSEGGARLAKRGFYQAQQGGTQSWFGAALLNRAETLLDGTGPAGSEISVARGHPLAFWLVLLAVAVLVAESILYHRRKAG